jgi:hypothetical protein
MAEIYFPGDASTCGEISLIHFQLIDFFKTVFLTFKTKHMLIEVSLITIQNRTA